MSAASSSTSSVPTPFVISDRHTEAATKEEQERWWKDTWDVVNYLQQRCLVVGPKKSGWGDIPIVMDTENELIVSRTQPTGEFVGYLVGYLNIEDGGDVVGEVVRVEVCEKYRRHGVGKWLVTTFEQNVREQYPLSKVSFSAIQPLGESAPFWEKMGYRFPPQKEADLFSFMNKP
jgi:GNAT superfamily N-acetyltransferase